jgi:dCMP deaminase
MRISRQHMFMNMAEVAAMRSTCFRGSVGALVVKDNDVVSVGYNGPPSGEDHCFGANCPTSDTHGCVRSDHAEKNAMARAMIKLRTQLETVSGKERGEFGNSLGRCDLYCTYSPCLECAKIIFNNYVNRLFYRHSYRDRAGLEYLVKHTSTMGVYKITPSGIIISERSRNIVAPEDIR